MSIKINQLEIENVKRIRACRLEPSENGLTIIGGKNNQGKTSTLDAIAWALGGEKYRPTQAMREGSVIPPAIRLKLSNGLLVERAGKNSDLKVTDLNGKKSGQQLLNEFVEQLALDLPRFMNSKDKADTLLKVIGVGDQLYGLEQEGEGVCQERLAIGRIADQKKEFAKEMTYHTDAPKDLVSISDLLRQQQDILVENGENQRKRDRRDALLSQVGELEKQIARLNVSLAQLRADVQIANMSAQDLQDHSTEELERNIANIELINAKVRDNLDKGKAEDDALLYERQYDVLSKKLEEIRKKKADLLNGAKLPLPGLSVEGKELLYCGKRWDCMSASDQLKVSAAIVRALNPNCGFVLLDKLEQMDLDTLHEFGAWLESEHLQAIATRVSVGDECSIIIEDGYVMEATVKTKAAPAAWKAGEF